MPNPILLSRFNRDLKLYPVQNPSNIASMYNQSSLIGKSYFSCAGCGASIEVQGRVGPTGLRELFGGLPGPALVGLAPTQAIKLRAFSPSPSRSPSSSNL
jgi:hypothetical protein